MSHYLTNDEIKAKTEEVNRLQENPDHCLSLVFHKDEQGWAAEVPTHTRSENAMVFGADIAVGRIRRAAIIPRKFPSLKALALFRPFVVQLLAAAR